MNRTIQELFNYLSALCAKNGFRFVLTSARRTCTQQLEISGVRSYHVVGEAFDALVQPYNPKAQEILGRIAIAYGFRWGGTFGTRDVVHFDNGLRARVGDCGVQKVGGLQLAPVPSGSLRAGYSDPAGGSSLPYAAVGEPCQEESKYGISDYIRCVARQYE